MIETSQLGWRVPESVWTLFRQWVSDERGATDEYLRFELHEAIDEFLECMEILDLMREHPAAEVLSSSTLVDRLVGAVSGPTTQVGSRVKTDLKQRFTGFADQHDAGYGKLLGAALKAYVDRSLPKIVLSGVRDIVDSSTVEAPTGSVERTPSQGSVLSTDRDSASTRPMMRSAWEIDVYTLLEESPFDFAYEPRAFELDDGREYTPDFIVGDSVVVEVKGRLWNDWSVERAQLFMREFPDYEYLVVGNDEVPCDTHLSWSNRDCLEDVLSDFSGASTSEAGGEADD